MGHNTHQAVSPHHTDPGASIHQLILLPGGKVKYFCKDVLSSLDVMQVGKILNFGGNLVPVNCGTANQYVALWQAYLDMWGMANYSRSWMETIANSKMDETDDYYRAMQENVNNFAKFMQTDEYKAWISGKDVKELQFQTILKHVCGHEYHGSLPHELGHNDTNTWSSLLSQIKSLGYEAKALFTA